MRSIPAGCVSLNCTFVSGVALGLVTVTVMIERPPTSTVDGLNELVIVAGTTCAKASPVKDRGQHRGATRHPIDQPLANRQFSCHSRDRLPQPQTASIAVKTLPRPHAPPPEPIARMALRYL
jgi:hypothetical protein